MRLSRFILVVIALVLLVRQAGAQTFSIADESAYSKDRGHGFDLGTKPDGDKPWSFSVSLPEGNYNIMLLLGDRKDASETTVKAESRRLMLENIKTEPGNVQVRTITVNIRTPDIAGGGGQVKLKPRENGVLHWDDKLGIRVRK